MFRRWAACREKVKPKNMNEAKLTDFTSEQLLLFANLMQYCKTELQTVTSSEKDDIDLLIIQILNAKLTVQQRETINQN